jgi:hypothetical protein
MATADRKQKIEQVMKAKAYQPEEGVNSTPDPGHKETGLRGLYSTVAIISSLTLALMAFVNQREYYMNRGLIVWIAFCLGVAAVLSLVGLLFRLLPIPLGSDDDQSAGFMKIIKTVLIKLNWLIAVVSTLVLAVAIVLVAFLLAINPYM